MDVVGMGVEGMPRRSSARRRTAAPLAPQKRSRSEESRGPERVAATAARIEIAVIARVARVVTERCPSP